ncbi:MAG: glycoside hydrolase family 19 protein [Rhizobiaceae bacterium]|nr:glycoside hydrolase family 19 protein [Rhizobiaceae bacterium]
MIDFSKILTASTIHAICPGARPDIVEALLTDPEIHFPAANIDDVTRLAHFVAQVATESAGLSTLVENLNYTNPARLMEIFPSKFPTLEKAKQYVKQPEKLANYVYANRLGNGGVTSGDGWAYRGSGLIQLTGRTNFRTTGDLVDAPLESEPELARISDSALSIALGYWRARKISDVAGDASEAAVEAVTKRINPPMVGLKERKAYFKKAHKLFSQLAKADGIVAMAASAPPAAGIGTAITTAAVTGFSTSPAAGGELSGPQWVARFPTSRLIEDLAQPFAGAMSGFVGALRAAGATVHVSATYRPRERAYLMHWAWQIAKLGYEPANVPPMPGVNVVWTHSTLAKSKKAARDMVAAYGIVHKPALNSRHTEKLAVDMTVSWGGDLRIRRSDGTNATIASQPRNGGNQELWRVGAGYGAIKLPSDPPHWSNDGR